MTRTSLWIILLGLCLSATPGFAQQKGEKCWPSADTTYTLSSVNTTPGANGIDVRGYGQHLTMNFDLTAGTIVTAVEVKTQAGNWVALTGGPVGNDFHGSLNPDHIVVDFLRLNTTTCTGCTAAAQICSYPDPQ